MAEEEKITIKLSHHAALAIFAFLKEFDAEFKSDKQFTRILAHSKEFENEIFRHLTDKMIEDAVAQVKVDALIGLCPNKNNKGENIT